MGNVQRLPSLGQTNIYLRESKETLSRCFIMEHRAVLTQHYRHPHQESSVHRQLGLFVVVFREEIHRKQDFMVAKSALNFFSLFFLIFIFEQEIIHFGLLIIKCSSVRVGGEK